MEHKSNDFGDGFEPWVIDPAPIGFLKAPLDYFFADHHRQRQAAAALHLAADGEMNAEGLSRLISFLQTDLVLHMKMEERGLFPLLKICCRTEDDFSTIFARLLEERRSVEGVLEETIEILRSRLAGEICSAKGARTLASFANNLRNHLTMENAVLLPIARLRMDRIALYTLSDIIETCRTDANKHEVDNILNMKADNRQLSSFAN